MSRTAVVGQVEGITVSQLVTAQRRRAGEGKTGASQNTNTDLLSPQGTPKLLLRESQSTGGAMARGGGEECSEAQVMPLLPITSKATVARCKSYPAREGGEEKLNETDG